MTRDDAVKAVCSRWNGTSDANGFILALEELGLLKLEEPKNALTKAIDIIECLELVNFGHLRVDQTGYAIGREQARAIMAKLIENGLKIVEKEESIKDWRREAKE